MGYYINPPDSSKEEWLAQHGTPISSSEAATFIFDGECLPVCLVNNGAFTAAGIAYDPRERDAFIRPDYGKQRPRRWFKVPKHLLEPWL